MTIGLFHRVSEECSKIVTVRYSTSFSSAIKLLHKDLRIPVFNIYGFVRFADEIVDTFHDYNKKELLNAFRSETFEAIERGISLNPILNSFQQTARRYKIDPELIHAFFRSMETDLTRTSYVENEYEEYIYGSAEVVGLMCLHVFCEADQLLYNKLKPAARALGAAFQKVNFLRDMKGDHDELSRIYFPGCDFHNFSNRDKIKIEKEIETDFKQAINGIMKLPLKARLGVYVAYKYYYSLFSKIKTAAPEHILQQRIRVSNYQKVYIVLKASVKNGLRLI
jgi:phytoene synthase